jgi:hypothetical protein
VRKTRRSLSPSRDPKVPNPGGPGVVGSDQGRDNLDDSEPTEGAGTDTLEYRQHALGGTEVTDLPGQL